MGEKEDDEEHPGAGWDPEVNKRSAEVVPDDGPCETEFGTQKLTSKNIKKHKC